MVEPSKIRFDILNTIPQKEEMILLYIGYHSIPKLNTTHLGSNRETERFRWGPRV